MSKDILSDSYRYTEIAGVEFRSWSYKMVRMAGVVTELLRGRRMGGRIVLGMFLLPSRASTKSELRGGVGERILRYRGVGDVAIWVEQIRI